MVSASLRPRPGPPALALFGAPPAFSEALHVGRPNVGERERFFAYLDGALDRRELSNDGPLVRALEHTLREQCDVAFCVATNNATSALEIAARALGLTAEVIMPSFTFVATANAIRWIGATPVFCDVVPGGYHLDPEAVAAAITERTTGILPVHVYGIAADVERFAQLARHHRLPLLYDAAHALGCRAHGRALGAYGDAAVLSFHATKIVNGFEGGAILTNDGALAERCALLRNHGFVAKDTVGTVGINAKMSEASAAMTLTNLAELRRFIAINREHLETYREGLAGLPGVGFVTPPAHDDWNAHYVILEIDPTLAPLDRDRVMQVLHAENVLARRYFHPGCHRQTPYLDPARPALPETDRASERVLSLPTGTAVSVDDVRRVCGIITLAMQESGAVREALDRGARA